MTPEKILIVDDNPANIRLLSEALEQEGHEILTASDGESGLRIASLAKPGLILLELMIPLRAGLATCRKLNTIEATGEPRVIFIPPRQDTESVLSGFRSGAV